MNRKHASASLVVPSGVRHPIKVPPGSTHFKLKKGGLNGLDCPWTDANQVTVDQIPLEFFDNDWITQNFGHDANFRVMFLQESEPGKMQAKGTWRPFGLVAEVMNATGAVTDPSTGALVQPQGGAMGSFESIMAIMMGMKDSARIDSEAVTAQVTANANAQVQMARESGQQNLALMATFLTKTMELGRPAQSAVDPAMMMLIQEMREDRKMMLEMIQNGGADEETEEEEKERLKEDRMKGLVRKVRSGGVTELISFVKDLAVDELIDYLPELRKRFPEFVAVALGQLKQMAAAQQAQMAAQQQAAAQQRAPAPPPRATRRRIVSPPPPPESEEGAPPLDETVPPFEDLQSEAVQVSE